MLVLIIKLLFGVWLEKKIQENHFQKLKQSVIKIKNSFVTKQLTKNC